MQTQVSLWVGLSKFLCVYYADEGSHYFVGDPSQYINQIRKCAYGAEYLEYKNADKHENIKAILVECDKDSCSKASARSTSSA